MRTTATSESTCSKTSTPGLRANLTVNTTSRDRGSIAQVNLTAFRCSSGKRDFFLEVRRSWTAQRVRRQRAFTPFHAADGLESVRHKAQRIKSGQVTGQAGNRYRDPASADRQRTLTGSRAVQVAGEDIHGHALKRRLCGSPTSGDVHAPRGRGADRRSPHVASTSARDRSLWDRRPSAPRASSCHDEPARQRQELLDGPRARVPNIHGRAARLSECIQLR